MNGDVVGFSRMMADDEDATVAALEAAREQVENVATRHGGRVVDFIGDNFLAEFPDADGALCFALAVQSARLAANRSLREARRLRFRLGVHAGTVRADGERIYGDQVNIAARLQSLATPDGVCSSSRVREQARGVHGLLWEDLGHRALKNIPYPVHVYRVKRGNAAEASADLGQPTPEPLPLTPFSGRPAIAVLPFDNLSSDPEQEFFADGIADDLITRLARQCEFPVISRSSTFSYKGRPADPREVGRELDARYVVEGGVRCAGSRVRITAQLIDASSGHHVWAESFDRERGDVFALQDEIAQAIAAAMHPELIRHETDRVLKAAPANLDAWENALRGFWFANHSSLAHNVEARTFFDRALALDPRSHGAHCGLVMTHYMDTVHLHSTERDWHALEAHQHAVAAAELAPDDPEVHVALGNAARLQGRDADAIAEYERAASTNPNLVTAHSNLGSMLAAGGRSEDAIAHLESALRLSPCDPWAWAFHLDIGTAHVAAARYEEAVEAIERSLAQRPDWANAWGILAAACAHLGRDDEAQRAAAEFVRRAPGVTLRLIEQGLQGTRIVGPVVEGLRLAGLE